LTPESLRWLSRLKSPDWDSKSIINMEIDCRMLYYPGLPDYFTCDSLSGRIMYAALRKPYEVGYAGEW
jgi:hypothetical protein